MVDARRASSWRNARGQSLGIDDHMNVTCQTTSRPSHQLFSIARFEGAVLMAAHGGRTDHLHGRVVRAVS